MKLASTGSTAPFIVIDTDIVVSRRECEHRWTIAIDPAGQAGLAALIGLLRREDVAAVVLASTEGKTVLLTSFYQALLGRNPTPAELGALLPAVRTGTRDEQVVATLVGSQEYLALP